MITIDGDVARIVFPWPTNDTAGGVLTAMATQATSLVRGHGRRLVGGVGFHSIDRAGSGYEFVFTAKLRPEEAPSG